MQLPFYAASPPVCKSPRPPRCLCRCRARRDALRRVHALTCHVAYLVDVDAGRKETLRAIHALISAVADLHRALDARPP